jgi:hypothetical protein
MGVAQTCNVLNAMARLVGTLSVALLTASGCSEASSNARDMPNEPGGTGGTSGSGTGGSTPDASAGASAASSLDAGSGGGGGSRVDDGGSGEPGEGGALQAAGGSAVAGGGGSSAAATSGTSGMTSVEAGGAGAGGRTCPEVSEGECNPTICPSTLPPEATTCAVDSNECGCDGMACAAGASGPGLCVRIDESPLIGFGSVRYERNICAYELCTTDDACSAPERCIRDRRGLPVCSSACRFDSECTKDCGGRCEPARFEIHGGSMEFDYALAHCVYEGSCGTASCAGCLNAGIGGGASTGDVHTCGN